MITMRRCRFTWLRMAYPHERVRCSRFEGITHGRRHQSGAAWVQVGYEAEFADGAQWLPEGTP